MSKGGASINTVLSLALVVLVSGYTSCFNSSLASVTILLLLLLLLAYTLEVVVIDLFCETNTLEGESYWKAWEVKKAFIV